MWMIIDKQSMIRIEIIIPLANFGRGSLITLLEIIKITVKTNDKEKQIIEIISSER